MPKKALLKNHYSCDQLKQKYLKTQDQVESRRWHLLWKISLGWSVKNSSLAVGISYGYAKEIVQRYNNQGEKGVKNLRNKNQKTNLSKNPLLTQEQIEMKSCGDSSNTNI